MTHRVIATAGHVDHGKSTVVAALTGMWPDQLREERERGLTIELGHVHGELPPTPQGPDRPLPFAVVDVPGHQRFLRTMLAGVSAVPSALFVVAVDDGWSAQSADHLRILSLLHIPVVAVALTKCDLVDASRIDRVTADIEAELQAAALPPAPIVPVDARHGYGIEDLQQALRRGLDRLPVPTQGNRPRLWIDRAFTIEGAGTVVTGTLLGGRVEVGLHGRLLPADIPARLRGLQSLGSQVDAASAGERVACNLAGVDRADVHRGDALVLGEPWRTSQRLTAWARTAPGVELTRRGAWSIHVGTAQAHGRVRPLNGSVAPGQTGAIELALDHPLPLVTGDRLLLLELGTRTVVAAASVADPSPPRHLGRGASSVVQRLAASSPADRLGSLVAAHGGIRGATEALAAADRSASSTLPADLLRADDVLVTRDRFRDLANAVEDLGAGLHPRERMVERLQRASVSGPHRGALINLLVACGQLSAVPGGLVLGTHEPDPSAHEARIEAFLEELRGHPFDPPDVGELRTKHGVSHQEVNTLVQARRLVRAGPILFAPTAVEHALELLTQLQADVGPFTAAAARSALGTSRKFAIPLLDHLRRTGRTEFDGQHHRIKGADELGARR